MTANVRRLQQYLLATLDMTGYGVFTWEVPADRFSDDSQIDEVLGVPFMRDHDGRALPRMRALVHPADLDGFDRRLAASLSPGGPEFRSEHRLLLPRAGGAPEERWVSVIGRCEFSSDGTALALVGVFGDVTDRRAEHDARLRREKLEALGTLTSGVAHDFNNVIGAIINFVQLAQHELGAGHAPHESLDEIHRGANRAADLVRGLLAFGREDPPRRVTFDLGQVVDEASALMAPAMGPQVVLAVRHDDGLPPVDGDPTQLHQVVVNLISNARQAIGDEPGRIDVTLELAQSPRPGARTTERRLQLRVVDDGPGISEAVRTRIFDPFFTTRDIGEGTGLGLSSSQGIVERHGGTITACNAMLGGAIFTVHLPVAGGAGDRGAAGATPATLAHDTDAEAGEDAESADRDAESAHHDVEPADDLRVCFVDDEEALAMLARRALPHSGCAVQAFTDPHEALAALQADPQGFDVLITDFSMPGMSGLELIVAARELHPELPAVLTSGHLDREDLADAERCRVEAIIHKPCSMDDLVQAAREQARPGQRLSAGRRQAAVRPSRVLTAARESSSRRS